MSEQLPDTLYCANHPDTPTNLRCNRCEKPICVKCAVLTPTGYRCRECVRGQQKVFDTAKPLDPLIAAAVAAPLSLGGSYISGFMGFFTIFVAPMAGMLIAEAVRWAVHRRRSRTLFLAADGAALAGALVFPLIYLVNSVLAVSAVALPGEGSSTGASLITGVFSLLGLLWYGVYAFLVTSTVYYRLRGIHISR